MDCERSNFPLDASRRQDELLSRAKAGDPEAFGELVLNLELRVFRQACLLVDNPALAEDLAQETFFTAWKRIEHFHGRCQLFTWLCGILINLARNASRRKAPLSFSDLTAIADTDHATCDDLPASISLTPSQVDPANNPGERLQQLERTQVIHACLQRLPEKHREIIHLRFFVDDSLEGIAAALDCPLGTVKSRLSHALEKLCAMPELHPFSTTRNVP